MTCHIWGLIYNPLTILGNNSEYMIGIISSTFALIAIHLIYDLMLGPYLPKNYMGQSKIIFLKK